MNENRKIIWHAPEFKYQSKDISWYWLTIIAAGILFLISLWQKNLLFVIFIIIAETMLVIWAKDLPRNLQFKLDKKGVHIGKIKSYQYEELNGFHIIEDTDETGELILKTKNKLHPYEKILIASKDIPEIKAFLKNHLEEIDYEESLSDGISRMIGF